MIKNSSFNWFQLEHFGPYGPENNYVYVSTAK